ncbi:hypothetical protein ACPEEL_02240 [Pasteurella sp. PK-2025]|uniref:hypothetical protein n=1 Tax=unclassified Pasteurella TaxID=2621516 RepID=UPI003C7447E9
MNVLEIHRKYPDAVFITRGGNKVKIKTVRPYLAIVEPLDGSGKTQYSVSGLGGYFLGPDKPDPLDIVDCEKSQYTITVNGKEFHPIKNPKNSEEYAWVDVKEESINVSRYWGMEDAFNALLVNLNLVYRTREEAQAFLNEITKPNAEIKYE